jgi:hypothetical protein
MRVIPRPRSLKPVFRRLENEFFVALLTILVAAHLSTVPRALSADHGDLYVFLQSGDAAAHGRDPYSVLLPMSGPSDVVFSTPNLNPPILIPVFAVASSVAPQTATKAYYVLSLVLYAITVGLLARTRPTDLRTIIWSLAVTGLWDELGEGQVYVPLLFLTVGALLLLLRRKRIMAGLLIGLVIAVKPNFAVWPALLLLAGGALTAAAAAISVVLLSLAPALLYGPTIYSSWLHAISVYAGYWLPANGSLLGFTTRLGVSWAGLPLEALLLGGPALLVWRRRPDLLTTSETAVALSLLASPIAWPGYSVFVVPAFYLERWTTPLGVAATLLVVPVAVVDIILRDFLPSPLMTSGTWHFVAFALIAAHLVMRCALSRPKVEESTVAVTLTRVT